MKKILLCCCIAVLLSGVFFTLTAPKANAAYVNCTGEKECLYPANGTGCGSDQCASGKYCCIRKSCSNGGTCQEPSSTLDCAAEGVCDGTQQCCKPKSVNSSANSTPEDQGFLPKQTGGKGCPPGVENCGDYSLNDFIRIALLISNWILGITGSLALLMFIYGGVMFLISSGNTERITKAKQIIIGAVIGLVIVFAAYTIISFTFKATGLKWEGTTGQPGAIEEEKKPVTPPPS